MNYLWETLLQSKRQGIPRKKLRYKIARNYSAYIEISNACLNQEEIGPDKIVEVNPYYRFYDIFKDMYVPEMKEFPKLRECLFHLVIHQLAKNDLFSGMTKFEYYKKLLYSDIMDGCFGEAAQSAMSLFSQEEHEIILSGLLRQYETGSSLDLFGDMMQALIKNNIVYHNKENPCEILIYIGQKKEKQLEQKMDFLIKMFVDIPYVTELYYEHHFGIIGIEETMLINEITLC